MGIKRTKRAAVTNLRILYISRSGECSILFHSTVSYKKKLYKIFLMFTKSALTTTVTLSHGVVTAEYDLVTLGFPYHVVINTTKIAVFVKNL
jgi:hypothetical protein